MPFSILPPRRTQPIRRSPKADDRPDEAYVAETANLPVPVGGPRSIPAGSARVGGDSAIHAQVIGERRGLRAGPTIHDEAKTSYNKTAWSGASDRRRPKGRVTKTEI